MKITKIMTDVLKLVEKGKTQQANYGVDDQFIYLTLDGHKMYKIHNNDFYIDLRKALSDKIPLTNPRKFFNEDCYEVAEKTSEMRQVKKFTVVKIANEKKHAWINVNYLKDFESDCTFKIVNKKSGVLVYENGTVVGLILPVNVEDGD